MTREEALEIYLGVIKLPLELRFSQVIGMPRSISQYNITYDMYCNGELYDGRNVNFIWEDIDQVVNRWRVILEQHHMTNNVIVWRRPPELEYDNATMKHRITWRSHFVNPEEALKVGAYYQVGPIQVKL